MKSFLNLVLIGLITMGSMAVISCCKPESHSGKNGHHHEHHSKMHHEHGDK